MPKTFYTEHEIEDLFKSGVTRLEMDDNVVLTGLAYEKAVRLGIQLVQSAELPSDAPMRPYISKSTSPATSSNLRLQDSGPSYKPGCNSTVSAPSIEVQMPIDLSARIKNAVIAKLGSNVDQSLLDAIIRRVLNQVKV